MFISGQLIIGLAQTLYGPGDVSVYRNNSDRNSDVTESEKPETHGDPTAGATLPSAFTAHFSGQQPPLPPKNEAPPLSDTEPSASPQSEKLRESPRPSAENASLDGHTKPKNANSRGTGNFSGVVATANGKSVQTTSENPPSIMTAVVHALSGLFTSAPTNGQPKRPEFKQCPLNKSCYYEMCKLPQEAVRLGVSQKGTDRMPSSSRLISSAQQPKPNKNGSGLLSINIPQKFVTMESVLRHGSSIVVGKCDGNSVGADLCVCPKIDTHVHQGEHVGSPLQNPIHNNNGIVRHDHVELLSSNDNRPTGWDKIVGTERKSELGSDGAIAVYDGHGTNDDGASNITDKDEIQNQIIRGGLGVYPKNV